MDGVPLKVIGITSAAVLSLLLGIAAPAYAQREQRGEKQARPEPQHGQQQRLNCDSHLDVAGLPGAAPGEAAPDGKYGCLNSGM
ncbi:MAG: hypothetical protein WBN92_16285 [Terriglobia bacterium]